MASGRLVRARCQPLLQQGLGRRRLQVPCRDSLYAVRHLRRRLVFCTIIGSSLARSGSRSTRSTYTLFSMTKLASPSPSHTKLPFTTRTITSICDHILTFCENPLRSAIVEAEHDIDRESAHLLEALLRVHLGREARRALHVELVQLGIAQAVALQRCGKVLVLHPSQPPRLEPCRVDRRPNRGRY